MGEIVGEQEKESNIISKFGSRIRLRDRYDWAKNTIAPTFAGINILIIVGGGAQLTLENLTHTNIDNTLTLVWLGVCAFLGGSLAKDSVTNFRKNQQLSNENLELQNEKLRRELDNTGPEQIFASFGLVIDPKGTLKTFEVEIPSPLKVRISL